MRSLALWVVAASLLLATAASAYAQDQSADGGGLEIGAKAGLSATGLEFSGTGTFFENERGFTAGVYVTRSLFSMFDVTVEGLYSRKGALDIIIDRRIVIDYVEVPILLSVGTDEDSSTVGVYGFVGPSLNLRLRARFGDANATDNYERYELAMVGGGGAKFGRYLVEGRVTWGRSNVAVDLLGSETITNRAVTVLGGFRFR